MNSTCNTFLLSKETKCTLKHALKSCEYRRGECTCTHTNTKLYWTSCNLLTSTMFRQQKNIPITHSKETNICRVTGKMDVDLPSKGRASMTKRLAVGVIQKI